MRVQRTARDMDDGNSIVVGTVGGVEAADQPPGEITVTNYGGTVLELLVDDGEGNSVSVWLGYHQAAALVFAVGASAVSL